MNADGTLSARELRTQFPPPDQDRRYLELPGTEAGTQIAVGDFVRVVAYNAPSWSDALWDTPQENAEERSEQVVQFFAEHGIVALLHQVRGQEISDRNGDQREAYVYDLEVVGFAAVPEDQYEVSGWPTWGQVLQLMKGAAILIGVTTIGASIAKVTIVGPGTGGRMLSNTVFWIALAAVAVSAAVIVKSARSAAP